MRYLESNIKSIFERCAKKKKINYFENLGVDIDTVAVLSIRYTF